MQDRYLQLLTAFLDGELSKRQRKAALRLLHRSSEARAILKDLQEQAHALKQLPRRTLGEEFSRKVMAALPANRPQTRPATPAARTAAPWARRLVWAAGLLIALGLGGYVWQRSADTPVPIVKNTEPKESLPIPATVLAEFRFQDLNRDTQQQQRFVKQIARESAVHLEVTVQNEAQAVTRLQSAFQDKGIRVVVDRATPVKPGQKHDYLVYAENITPDELRGVLQNLGSDAAKTTFDTLQVVPFTPEDGRKLAGVFGLESSQFQSAGPLFKETFIEKAETKSPPKPVNPPVVSDPRYAVIVADRGTTESSEIRNLLKQRTPRKPGTMQVMMVVHVA